MGQWRHLSIAAAALLFSAGCAAPTRTFVLRPEARANGGDNFYLVARSVAERDFFLDSYQKMVGMVFPVSKDPNIKLVQLIRPGQVERVKITIAEGESLAVYALFTQPGDPWKVLISPPLHKQYELRLAGSQIILEPQSN
jgi:hypothetical protein